MPHNTYVVELLLFFDAGINQVVAKRLHSTQNIYHNLIGPLECS